MDADQLTATAGACAQFLRSTLDADWTRSVPDLDFTVAGVVGHAAEASLWYAIDLSAGGRDLGTTEQRVRTDAEPGALIDTVLAYSAVLAAVVRDCDDEARGFHPFGIADRSGFVAMACDELLIHTADAALGLGTTFRPPDHLVGPVLARLFPWVTADDPWDGLRWANGRIAVPGRERLGRWRWWCAPLSDWDGRPVTVNEPS